MRNLPYRIAYTACACVALFAALAAQGAELTQDPVEAIWKAQRLVFHYRSEGTMYSCDVLAHKTKIILRQLGARDRIELRRVRCRDFAQLAQLEVFMESPVVATSENIRSITHYDSEDVLIARVRGMPLPSPENLERFPAVWQTTTLRKLPLEGRDCALVQQLRSQILPKMSVQVIKDIKRVNCGLASPRLTVLALVAISGERAGGNAKRAADDRVGSVRARLETLSKPGRAERILMVKLTNQREKP